MSDNIIEVSGLTKRYGKLTAVDDLNFGIGRGKIYGFLGPNGAGKSTTMNMMTGYLAPSEGTVSVNGHDIYKEPDLAKKSIGYLPEIPPLYTDMTVDEYLIFVAELKGIKGKERREEADRCESRTGLSGVAGRLIGNLSKGYRQRVGVAQALIGSPDIIILDEPTVGLDPRQIIEIRTLITDLGKDHTVILSSHILSEVAAVCDTLMVISKGKLVANGTPDELRKLSGGTRLEIAAPCSPQMMEKTLSGIPEIEDITLLSLENEDRDINGLTLALKDRSRDIRADVFRRFADAGIPLVRISKTEQTLEDVFLRLTSEDPDVGESADVQSGDTEPASGVSGDASPADGEPASDVSCDVNSEDAESESGVSDDAESAAGASGDAESEDTEPSDISSGETKPADAEPEEAGATDPGTDEQKESEQNEDGKEGDLS